MQVFILMKQIGKRQPVIGERPLLLQEAPMTLRHLIGQVVAQEVERYNALELEADFVRLLTQEDMQEQAANGKIGFGRRYQADNQSVRTSIETACQAFEDGLYKVVINEEVIDELDSPLQVNENDRIVFIRLTMLAGRLWP
ncbi:hypothetical protein GZH47_11000 [Paenibacillus rhizovicinus]|uniref:Uncharacterized protein n=1 Tax=Paenibacillus rhizovicinus TaxID=2704463 RepID=A0A6C0P092_9BACL|nr:hypothetical protein [Paenibacillus rhizovicinus]QHW31333.1 hypothetical protein GZH47_11000 [Paenibacillus rhizovicinus]